MDLFIFIIGFLISISLIGYSIKLAIKKEEKTKLKKSFAGVGIGLVLMITGLSMGGAETDSQTATSNKEIQTTIATDTTKVDESKSSNIEPTNNTQNVQPIQPKTESVQQPSTENNQSQTVYIGATGTKYHRESCRTLKGTKTPITLDEAKAQGREACKVCKP